MEELNFSHAVIEDLVEITNIYNSTISSRLVTADTEEVTVASRLNWFYEHNQEKRPLWMVHNKNNELIGWVSFSSFYGRPAYSGTAEISIYLHEDHRNMGYGKAILEYCILEAKNFEIKTLLAFIFKHNTPSISLFKKLNFEEWGVLPNVAVMDNNEYSLCILGKRIY